MLKNTLRKRNLATVPYPWANSEDLAEVESVKASGRLCVPIRADVRLLTVFPQVRILRLLALASSRDSCFCSHFFTSF